MASSVRSKAEADHDFDLHVGKLNPFEAEECHMPDRLDPDGNHKREHSAAISQDTNRMKKKNREDKEKEIENLKVSSQQCDLEFALLRDPAPIH